MTKFFPPGDMVWRCFSQVRETTANDNSTPFMQMQAARAMEQWAASRAGNPAFAAMCFVASCKAQAMRRAARGRQQ